MPRKTPKPQGTPRDTPHHVSKYNLKREKVKSENSQTRETLPQRIDWLYTCDRKKFAEFASSSLSQWRNGERAPSSEALAQMIQLTGCSASWLLLGEGEAFPALPSSDPVAVARLLDETCANVRAARKAAEALLPLLSSEQVARLSAALAGLPESPGEMGFTSDVNPGSQAK